MRTEMLVGNVAVLVVAFAVDDEATDPTTITLTIEAPDGTVTTPAPEHAGDGVYEYDLLLDAPGVWKWLWVGTGAAAAATQGVILATPQIVVTG